MSNGPDGAAEEPGGTDLPVCPPPVILSPVDSSRESSRELSTRLGNIDVDDVEDFWLAFTGP